MKVNRTYSMDYDLVIQLAKRVNQSETVCKAVRKYLEEKANFSLRDVSTKKVYAVLLGRMPDSDPLRRLIEERYNQA